MSKVIIYSGMVRTWEQVKENHKENIHDDSDEYVFYSVNSWLNNGGYIHWEKQLETFPTAIPLNAAPETHILNTLNQWRNRKKAFSLAPIGKDVYVIARFDLFFLGKIDFSNVQPNTVYIPSGNDFRDGINDQFAFGTYEAMKHYCSLYEAYIGYFNDGVQFHPETYLKHHLRNLNISRIPQTNSIIRND